MSIVPSDPPPSYEDASAHRPGGTPQPPQGASLQSPRGPPGPSRGPRPTFPLNLPVLVQLRGKRVVLASNSPRRREILAQIGLRDIDIVPSNFAEDLPKSLSPFEYVLNTASEKAMEVYKREIDNTEKGEPALVIAADTIIISRSGKILEKPRNEQDHISMLKMLRDEREHKVTTAVAVMSPNESLADPGYNMETHVEETTVKFATDVTDELILHYVRTRDGADKAGGYGIQSGGSVLIDRIEGSFDNVIGLPLRQTLRIIETVMNSDDDLDNDIIGSDEDEDGL